MVAMSVVRGLGVLELLLQSKEGQLGLLLRKAAFGQLPWLPWWLGGKDKHLGRAWGLLP